MLVQAQAIAKSMGSLTVEAIPLRLPLKGFGAAPLCLPHKNRRLNDYWTDAVDILVMQLD
jgi:hypothetical protein